MFVGIAHHLGWAVAVTAAPDFRVVDRRRLELMEPGLPAAPVEHGIPDLDDLAAAELLRRARAAAGRMASVALGGLASSLPGAVVSISLRAWPLEFPDDLRLLRRAPYNSQADSVMYRQVLAAAARSRGWAVNLFDERTVIAQASDILGARTEEVLEGPRATLGPPWTKDHRMALSAAVVAAAAYDDG